MTYANMVSLALIFQTPHAFNSVCGNDRDAKLSVLDWDDNAHTIHTSSLHYFEGDPSLRMGRTVFPMGPKVVTDPQVGVTVLLSTTHRFIRITDTVILLMPLSAFNIILLPVGCATVK